jgi:APA family basic amino acid/polyamine antiporter
MVRQLGSAGWLIAMWVLTGHYGCCSCEPGVESDVSKSGGQYVYYEAYGKLVGFLYGWSFFAVIQTGTIAAVGCASLQPICFQL